MVVVYVAVGRTLKFSQLSNVIDCDSADDRWWSEEKQHTSNWLSDEFSRQKKDWIYQYFALTSTWQKYKFIC